MDEKLLEQYSGKNIDLTPDWYKKKKKRRYLKLCALVLVLLAIFGSIYMYLDFADRISQIEEENEQLLKDIVKIQEQGKNQEMLTYIGNRIQFKEDLLTAVNQQNESIIKLIYLVERNMPTNIETLSMSVNSTNNLTLYGVADNKRSVSDFIHELKSEDYFTKVFVPVVNKHTLETKDERYSFNINLTFGGDNQ